MIRNYWKQLLVVIYIAIVLVLSATAKASGESVNHNDALLNLEKRLSEVIRKHSVEPSVNRPNSNFNVNSQLLIYPFEDIGTFTLESAEGRFLFISATSDEIFYVDSNDEITNSLHPGTTYLVKGLRLANIRPNMANLRSPRNNLKNYGFRSNKFLNSILVTSVETQR